MNDDGGWEEPYRSSERNRKMTQKGAEFTLENKSKTRYRCYNILSTLNDNLQKMLRKKDEYLMDLNKKVSRGLVYEKFKNRYDW